MPRVRVESGARLHFGFSNLSLANERLYGGLGLALDEPRVTVEAVPAADLDCDHEGARTHAATALDLLDLPGATVRVRRELPRHAGLGSGTQLALATLTAVARAHERDPEPRANAPALGRGGRSGVGVATFESGGFVLDAGHPTGRFTTARPADGSWRVPAPVSRLDVPDDWRFLVLSPAAAAGRSGADEDESMRLAVRRADPSIADRVAGVVVRDVLPALAEGDHEAFGAAVAEVGRLNGAWYADEQGGVYRPPAGELVAALADAPAVAGAGQSSWGPVVYGVTDAERAADAVAAGEDALCDAGVEGSARAVAARNAGARVETLDG